MAQERLAMRDIKELLRLRFGLKLSQRQTAKASGYGRTTVQEYEERARRGNLTSVEEFEKLSAEEIYERLGFKAAVTAVPQNNTKPLPDWKQVREDICRHKHVTMLLLWTEYKEQHPEGYQYSQFCDLYKQWSKKLSLTMRQEHKAGEKTFIDYAGSTIDIVDSETGEVNPAQIFVSCLGGSSYVYAEATMSQGMCDWLMSHRRMVEFYGGVSEILVPDNLKSGVTKADRYEAGVSKAYVEFCEHYGTCVIPARSGKPKDKAKAEVSVQIVSRWIIAALRNRTFYSLGELNEAICELLIKINNRKMRHIGKSRFELFESMEKSVLKPLPARAYEFGEWKKVTANIDYHVEFDDVFYSVHHKLTGEILWVRGTNSVIEIYKNLERIASHRRSFRKGKYVTEPSHRPVAHQEHAKWTPERIVSWANSKGDVVGDFVKKLIASKAHPEQGFRSSLGIIRLAEKYGDTRLQTACAKAIRIESINYQTVKNMLANNVESLGATDDEIQKTFFDINHENVRGGSYYH